MLIYLEKHLIQTNKEILKKIIKTDFKENLKASEKSKEIFTILFLWNRF